MLLVAVILRELRLIVVYGANFVPSVFVLAEVGIWARQLKIFPSLTGNARNFFQAWETI
jgi:hypothetical protein